MADDVDILREGFGRLPALVHNAVEGLDDDQLTYRLDAEANTIAWLVWHLTRIQDDHVADAASTGQIWTAKGWADRFGLPFEVSATGYAQNNDDVAAVRVPSSLLVGYFDDVYARTVDYLESLQGADLDRIVDRSWDPPVTLGARLVSVLSDDLQHAGQAALIRGVALRT